MKLGCESALSDCGLYTTSNGCKLFARIDSAAGHEIKMAHVACRSHDVIPPTGLFVPKQCYFSS
jgi:hypothetical protein